MHARVLIATLLLSTTLFSGCFGGDEGSPASETTGAASGGPDAGNATGGPGSPGETNVAPVAVLAVLSNGTELQASNGSYLVAAGENITVSAAGSTDADGDELSFAWSVDGNESEETGAELILAFEAGNHSVAVRVSDASQTSQADALIVAEGAAAAAGGVEVLDMTGKFVRGDATPKAVLKPFEVGAGIVAIQAWLTWDDGELGNSPLLVDLDMILLGPDGKNAVAMETSDFEYTMFKDEAKLVPGTWNAKIIPFGAGPTTAGASTTGIPLDTEWDLKIILWYTAPTSKVFTGSKAGVNLGPNGDAITGNVIHDYEVPAGTSIVASRLVWTNPASAAGSSVPRRVEDYDLYTFAAGKEQYRSGNGAAYEFGFVAPEEDPVPAGKWSFHVVPFDVVVATYTLEIFHA